MLRGGLPPGPTPWSPWPERVPAGRSEPADEVAAMVAFLLSDESSYCYGSEFVLDGGYLAGPVGIAEPATMSAVVKISLLFPETRSISAVRALAAQTENAGFHGMWLGSAFGFDPIMALALAGGATSTIQLGVAVVPTWPRHPLVMAQQGATASAACQGRFRLGVGPSHAPVMQMYGIDFDRPISHTREYLTVLRTLLADGFRLPSVGSASR